MTDTSLNPDALASLIEQVQEAIDHVHLDPREFFDLSDVLYHLKAVAHPEVNSVALFDAWEAGATYGHNAEGRLIDKLECNPYPNPDRPEVNDGR